MVRTFLATQLHVDKLCELNNRAHAFDKWELSRFQEMFDYKVPILIMANGKHIVGFVIYVFCLDESRIINVAIDNKWQGRGFGKRLINLAIERAKWQKMRYVMLDVRVGNTKALNLYHNCGFKVICRRANFYDSCSFYEDAFFMQLEL